MMKFISLMKKLSNLIGYNKPTYIMQLQHCVYTFSTSCSIVNNESVCGVI